MIAKGQFLFYNTDMAYDILLIDCDRTLYDYDKGEKDSLFKALSHYGLPATNKTLADFRKINNGFWEMHEKGLIEKKVLVVKRFEELFKKYGYTLSASEFNAYYKSLLSLNTYTIRGAYKLIRQAKKMGKRVYIITNGTVEVQMGRFARSPLAKYFDGVFVSEATGYAKPDKRYFDYVFEHIPNFDRQKAIVIGDSVSADIAGAVNAGLNSVLFCPKKTIPSPATYTVKKLTDVLGII